MARELKGERLEKELQRLAAMHEYEMAHADIAFIAGIDEAGRGPLAGPVVAACCILPKDAVILHLNDSKKVTPLRREAMFPEIKEKALAFGIGIVGEKRIDEINILQADYEAMRIALQNASVMLKEKGLATAPGLLLNDAVTIPGVELSQLSIIKGDTKSVSIAAASILAKVTRDHLMEQYDALYPAYGFARNKGYGTKEHIDALKQLGPCPIHRRSFIGHFVQDKNRYVF